MPTIKQHLPSKFNTYFEPFVGGGAVFLELQRKNTLINDRNKELINCYRVIQNSVEELIEALKRHQEENHEYYYYGIREWDRSNEFKDKPPVERAARIIYLNKTCYNGLFRVNSQGHFNVPFGRYKKPNILDIAVLRAVSDYLKSSNTSMLDIDFEEAVSSAKKGDFVYFDPPYDPVSDTSSFTGYDINGFNREEQIRLKKCADRLTDIGCKVMVSNAYTDFIIDLYSDSRYKKNKISAIRAINSNAEKRGSVDEVLITNYE